MATEAIGDISGDGKADLLVGQGCMSNLIMILESWTFHADWELHASVPMIVVDLDQDGMI